MGAGAAAAAGGSDAAVSLEGDGGGGQTSDGPPEHLSPGYGAGYDAGFQAGLLAASRGDTSPPPPQPGPVATDGGAGASATEPARPPMLALVEDFPDLFQKEVLERLDPVDRGLLGRTGSAVRAAVKRSGLPRVGGSAEEPRVGIAAFCQSLSTHSSGLWRAAARGNLQPRAKLSPRAGTWRCCDGRGSTAAAGTNGRVHAPLQAGTWRC